MKNIAYYNGKTAPIEEMTVPMTALPAWYFSMIKKGNTGNSR